MILEQKASFFVIFCGTQPIDICLNFHVDKTLYQYIRTFDIAYSKFNPGYLDLMKQIEWCIQNNIDSITFSKADNYWKRRWCNKVYNYDHEIFYKKRSFKSMFTAYKFFYKTKLIQYLREKGVIEKYHEFRDNRKKHRKFKLSNPIYEINIQDNVSINDASDNLKINYHNKKFDVLRRSIYEFLYATDEQEKDISVYKLKKNSNAYIVDGKAAAATITM